MNKGDAQILAMYDIEQIFDLIDEKLDKTYQTNENMSFCLVEKGRKCAFRVSPTSERMIVFDIPAVYLELVYKSFLEGVIKRYLPNENYRVSQFNIIKMENSRVWKGIEIKTSEGAIISIEMPKISMKLCTKYKEDYRDYIVSRENDKKITI